MNFRTVAADSGWNDTALQGLFLSGLSEQLKDELAARDDSDSLDSLVSLAIKLDNRLRERCREKASCQPPLPTSNPSPPSFLGTASGSFLAHRSFPSPNTPTSTEEEPMQLGRARLSPEERLRRMNAGECIYCGRSGHFLASCPHRPKEEARQ